MSSVNFLLNQTLNHIHHWSEPDQNPMKRMFLTRFAEIGCVSIEVCLIVKKTIEFGASVVKNLTRPVLNNQSSVYFNPLLVLELPLKAQEVARLIKGLASTLFFGIIFSPEVNFKIHLRLKLVLNNQAEKTQKERSDKLETELKKSEIIKMRNERFVKLEAEQQSTEEAEAQAYLINSRLIKLLLNKTAQK